MNPIIFLLPARKTRKVPDLRLIGYCCSSRLRNQSKSEGVLRIEGGEERFKTTCFSTKINGSSFNIKKLEAL